MTTLAYSKKSPIHGVGAFTKRALKAGQTLKLPSHRGFQGLNHSCNPNSVLVFDSNAADFVALALRDIPRWAELTVSYGNISKKKCNCPICGRLA